MFVKATISLPRRTPDEFEEFLAVMRALSEPVDGLTAAFSFPSKNIYSNYLGIPSVSFGQVRDQVTSRETDAVSIVLDFLEVDSVEIVAERIKRIIDESGYKNEQIEKSLFYQTSAY